ncbi:Anaerobic nitric oxide reductase transcription regulator NorR [Jeotgalicoccus aerolatus]|uniref:PAS domain S-box-containing protein n=1 Tax=Jeotgalicoccus aerolatus TaxID=709510 RepID=A0A1G9AJD5_9STAP|nr:sigma 54-interacting transcriptional regulator [Jeotgalicoccus aerolatus]MBP1952974.1 PAS domain S-box-containing protein [Jeotgalicoccus aerolatus]GGE01549.1 sigma-54-dependent Fis family transcriptional regulator [Jeotgalicoccus aerolatus]CAD2073152.1 Anaerobic nitric oxide reductase transcription regulator NorR [Jeotgalicoccus aerolatus]SDK26914.1 PAS domain S-box-containing protein [Jeotgalicoccus aerolatus]
MLDKEIINILINFHNYSFTIIDKEENVIYWSDRAAKIFNMDNDYVIGKKITDIFAEDKLIMVKSLRENKVIEKQQHKATENVYVDIKSVPICIDGKVEGAIVSEVNVTEKIQREEQIEILKNKVSSLSDIMQQLNNSNFKNIIYRSSVMERVKSQIERAAETNANILITGETGVGKELFAQAIHSTSKVKGDMVPINCGAIPSHLFESELFGYEKGAFTGANRAGNKGKVELAENGTLFLDEIGEMPIDMQVKFLRVLQEKQYFKLGGNKEINTNFRLVSATNKKISDLLSSEEFRLDLLYRVNVVNIHIPPLRERPEDIEALFYYYLYSMSEKYDMSIKYANKQLISELKKYPWPGNVRELMNVIERLVIFSNEETLNNEIFHQYLTEVGEDNSISKNIITDETIELKDYVEKIEADYIKYILDENNNNIEKSSEILGISRPTLYAKVKKFGL